jgi:hypothetical protein
MERARNCTQWAIPARAEWLQIAANTLDLIYLRRREEGAAEATPN